MKRIAFWTAIAMTASTAAFASPVRTADRDEPRVYDRDREVYLSHDHYDRYGQSHWANDFRGRWVPIARANARNDRTFIPVNGRFRRLRLEGLRGDPVIERVTIEFGNGSRQSVDLNASLPRGTGEVIDLNGDERRVRRIIIDAERDSRGAVAVWGA